MKSLVKWPMGWGKRAKPIFLFVLIMMGGACISACQHSTSSYTPVDGTLDLSAMNPEQIERIPLIGNWQFFHHQLLSGPYASDSRHFESKAMSGPIPVPGNWYGQIVLGEKIPTDTCGTYALRVILPAAFMENPSPLVLKVGEIGSASRVYINHKLIGQSGVPTCQSINEKPNTNGDLYIFQPRQAELDIYIQVSNTSYWKGGIWHPIFLGHAQKMHTHSRIQQTAEVGLLAVLLIMGIYHLAFVLFRRTALGPFYFGLVCLMVGLRLSIIGQKYLLYLFPELPWIWQIRLEYIALTAALTVFAVYIYKLFPGLFATRQVQTMLVIGGLYALFVLVTPTRVFTETIKLLQVYLLGYSIYAAVIVILGAIRKVPGAFPIVLGGSLLIITIINDVLLTAEKIETIRMGEIGMLAFIFSNAMVIARRVASALSREEKLSAELKKKNQSLGQVNAELVDLKENLEDQVRKRTLELEGALDKAESATHAKSLFLANMSHEIRTPLNAIMGFTELLEDTGLTDAQSREVAHVRRSSHHLLEIVNDILDFSRIEAGRLEIKPEAANLSQTLEAIRSGLGQLAARQNNEFKIEIDAVLPENLAYDSLRLNQILMNLVNNALKFTHDGQVHVKISLLQEAEQYLKLRFEVEDTGIGIAPEQQKKIFESFGQVDTKLNRNFGGTGLGLSIARMLLELMGSRLYMKSELGKGSLFWFDLSLSRSTTAIRPQIKKATDQLESFPGLRVLLVDDNEDNRMLAARFLSKWEVQYDQAEDGMLALEKFAEKYYDIILMDLQMPRMDGYEATRLIRERDKDIVIIALTAAALSEVREQALDAGMNEFISKPFRSAQLHAMLKQYNQR